MIRKLAWLGGIAIGAAASSLAFAATLERVVIEQTIEKHFDEVTTCYEEGLGRNAELAGTVTLRFAIDKNGAVASVNLAETTLKDKPVEDCLQKALKTWKFPKPKGSGTVMATYPFVLKTK